jgi:hypothetical protein
MRQMSKIRSKRRQRAAKTKKRPGGGTRKTGHGDTETQVIVTGERDIARGVTHGTETAATDIKTAQDRATGEGTAIENAIGAGTALGVANTDDVRAVPSLAENAGRTTNDLVRVRGTARDDVTRGADRHTRLRKDAIEQYTIDIQYNF